MAIGIMVLLVAGIMFMGMLRPATKASNDVYASREVVLRSVELPRVEPPPPLPPPPPPVEKAVAPKKPAKAINTAPKIQSQQVKTTKFTPPVIRKDEDVKSEIPPVSDMATIGATTQDGVVTEEIVLNVPVATGTPDGVDGGTGVIEQPAAKEEGNKIFEKVEIAATVDQSRWRRHLENRLVRYIEDAAARGMAAGQYTVMVRFLVEKDGSIDRVTALNDPGYGLAKGAEQVVKSGPHWEPGIQNGNKVRSYHTQPITFVILDS